MHDLAFFNLVTPSWITTSRISKSLELRFFIAYIVWSNHNHILVHQPAATNSIQPQSTRRLPPPPPPKKNICSTPSRTDTWNPNGGLWWSPFKEAVNVLSLLPVFAGELRCWILNVTLAEDLLTTGFTQGNPELLLSPNSLDSHQIKNNKAKFWTDPRSSFLFKENSSTG